jgi:hypothetical protein
MTETEIMKALWCCAEQKPCKECPLIDYANDSDKCKNKLFIDALALINRKNAEIERLEAEMKFIRQYIHDNGLEWDLLAKYKIAKEMGVELWG